MKLLRYLALVLAFSLPARGQGGNDPVSEIAPIAPPVPVFPYPAWMVACAVAAALLLLGLLVWAVAAWVRRQPKTPPLSPRQRALAALETLRSRVAQVEPYPFSIEVCDVLRSFVAREFRINATEKTSPEFLAAISDAPAFSETDKALLAAFLERADLIKFARIDASEADSEQLLEQASRFVKGGEPE